MAELRELIHNANLTKTQQKIAKYILDNSADACFMTSTEIALKLGVSESSIIRFSRSLGFNGFMDFQKSLRKDYQDKVLSISSAVTIPAQRVAKRAKLGTNSDYINRHLKNAVQNLDSIFAYNIPATFEKAANLIVKSKRKYVAYFPGECLPCGLFCAVSEAYGFQCRDNYFQQLPVPLTICVILLAKTAWSSLVSHDILLWIKLRQKWQKKPGLLSS